MSSPTFLDEWAVARTTRQQHRQKLGRLFKYCRDKLKRSVEAQPHAEICNYIDAALGDCRFTGDKKRQVMIGVPRGSWKTSLAVNSAPEMVLDINPNARILIDCYRHDMAKTRLRVNRRLIEKHYPEWQPMQREAPWSDEKIFVTTRTDDSIQEPSINTSGVDRSEVGGHYDVILVDDPVNDQNVRTEESRAKVYDHILDLLPILAPGGVIILLFTTWHVDDAYARIRKIDDERERTGKTPFWEKLIRGCYDGPTGLYFPSTLTHEYLNDQLAQMGPAKFSAQYLLNPIAREDQTFSAQALRIANFAFECTNDADGVVIPREAILTDGSARSISHTQILVAVTLAWDPAGRKGTKVRHDEHAFTMVGTDATDRWWVIEAEGHRGPPTDIITEAVNYILRGHPHTVSCEDNASSGLWLDLLRAELERRKIPVPLLRFYEPRSTPKEVRIELLQPRWERGGIVLRPNQRKLIHQISHFSPANELAHDDLLDSLQQHMDIAYPAASDVRGRVNPIDPEWVAREARRNEEEMPAWAASTLPLLEGTQRPDLIAPSTGRNANRWAI